MSNYRDIGCSQEDHLPNCTHLGYSGGYLSEHLPTCPCFKSNKAECNCNPKARQATFNFKAGQAARDAGLDRASNPFYRKELLEWARLSAKRIARAAGRVSYDDVYRVLEYTGKQPELLGSAAGNVFRTGEWESVGWKPSERKSNHARPMRVWRLK